MQAKFDKAAALVFKCARMVLSFILLVIVAVALLRLLGQPIPLLRLSEANLQSLGVFIAAAAYYLK